MHNIVGKECQFKIIVIFIAVNASKNLFYQTKILQQVFNFCFQKSFQLINYDTDEQANVCECHCKFVKRCHLTRTRANT